MKKPGIYNFIFNYGRYKDEKKNSCSYEGVLRGDSFDIRSLFAKVTVPFSFSFTGSVGQSVAFGAVSCGIRSSPDLQTRYYLLPVPFTSYWISSHCLLSSLNRPLTHVDGKNRREKARHRICHRFYSLAQIGRHSTVRTAAVQYSTGRTGHNNNNTIS